MVRNEKIGTLGGTVNLTWALRDEAFSFAFGYAALLIPEISRHAAKAAAR